MQRTPALRGAPLLSSRSVALAHAARERLEREYHAPPLFTELAHDIGPNQSKLKKERNLRDGR